MKLRILIPLLVLLSAATAARAELDQFRLMRMDRATYRARPMAMLPVDNLDGVLMVYGDRYGIVRVARMTDRGVQVIWRSSTLE